MIGEKPNFVWVSPGIRSASLSMLLAATLWALTTPICAQPLQPGIASSDGRHFLVDDGAIRVFSKDFQDGPKLKKEAVSTLYQGSLGWADSFLALTDKGVARVSTTAPQLELKIVAAGEALQVEPWGDNFLAFADKGSELTVMAAAGETNIPLTGALVSVQVVDSGLALVSTDKGLWTLRDGADSTGQLVDVSLPFPVSQAKTITGGGRVVIWSSESAKLKELAVASDKDTLLDLDMKPSYGVRLLDDGSVVAAGQEGLILLGTSGDPRKLPVPQGMTEASFAKWTMLVADGHPQIFAEVGDRIEVLRFDQPEGAPQTLPAGKFHAVVQPEPGQAGQTLLFWDTSFEEPKLDDEGDPVIDLATGKAMAPVPINGYQIFASSRESCRLSFVV